MLSDDLLKDILFQDGKFEKALDTLGYDDVYSEIERFTVNLAFQLKVLSGTDRWRRSVTALVIRAKNRLREIERRENL